MRGKDLFKMHLGGLMSLLISKLLTRLQKGEVSAKQLAKIVEIVVLFLVKSGSVV